MTADPTTATWLDLASHRGWLERHADHLLDFAAGSPLDGVGARLLDDDGRAVDDAPIHAYVTARMVHVHALGALLGRPGSAPLAAAAMSGLTGALHDDEHGGWFTRTDDGVPAAGKSCYDHAFVVLAAATATHAGIDGARELFDEAADTLLRRFWDDDAGRCLDGWDTAFREPEPYRGLNANMHAVEAMLAAEDVVGDGAWAERALRIGRFVVALAEAHDHRLPEHFDAGWNPLPAFNEDRPDDPFKPYGATVGHGFEWARLLVHLAHAPGTDPDDAYVTTAVQLFDRAAADGWAADGAPGFVYTTDWDGRPVVRQRFHWVAAEAIAAAAALHHQTGEARFARDYRRWWDHVATHHLDPVGGSWHHELDPDNRPASTVWPGKPDVYHALQATLVPRAPLHPMLGAALASGRLA